MGAKQSKRSVDISGGTKKGEVETGIEDGKLERLEEADIISTDIISKTVQNGTAPHTDKEASSPVTDEAQPTVNGDSETTETAEEKKEKEETEVAKAEEKKDESLVNGASGSPDEKDKSIDEAATPDSKEKKKKDKSKKKWSFRSISFSRKDKSKPNVNKDEAKNGNVTKEEPVAEVVEAEAAANTEAIPVKDDEPKKEEVSERTEEEKKEEKKEEESTTQVQSPEPDSPAPAEPTPAPVQPVPAVEPVAPPAAPQPVAEPTPVPEPEVETTSVPTVEATPPVEEPKEEQEVEVVPEPVVVAKAEELPPPLPASPPPTEAPPPTPVATTPAPPTQIPILEPDTQFTEVVGGGGESMADPVDEEPVLETEEKLDEAPLVNGISDHSHEFVEEISEKVEIVTDSFKTIVTESIISTQVVSENSEDNSEQTASAAE